MTAPACRLRLGAGRRRRRRRRAARPARLEGREGRERGHGDARPWRHAAAPAFSLERLDGEGELSLASLRGKAVVLNFWASWCVPCKDETPLLAAGLAALAGQGRRLRRRRRAGLPRRRARVHAPLRRHVPDRLRRQGLDGRPLRRHRLPRDVLRRRDGQGSPPHRRRRSRKRRARRRDRAGARPAREASLAARRRSRSRSRRRRPRASRGRPRPSSSRSSSARSATRRSTPRTRRSRGG